MRVPLLVRPTAPGGEQNEPGCTIRAGAGGRRVRAGAGGGRRLVAVGFGSGRCGGFTRGSRGLRTAGVETVGVGDGVGLAVEVSAVGVGDGEAVPNEAEVGE